MFLLLLLLLLASICYFLITRPKLLNIVCLFSCLVCCLFVYSVFVMFCVLFLFLYIAVSSLFVYKFTDHCHRVETQLQEISYITQNTQMVKMQIFLNFKPGDT
jgi:hypothetical protein